MITFLLNIKIFCQKEKNNKAARLIVGEDVIGLSITQVGSTLIFLRNMFV